MRENRANQMGVTKILKQGKLNDGQARSSKCN